MGKNKFVENDENGKISYSVDVSSDYENIRNFAAFCDSAISDTIITALDEYIASMG